MKAAKAKVSSFYRTLIEMGVPDTLLALDSRNTIARVMTSLCTLKPNRANTQHPEYDSVMGRLLTKWKKIR